MTKIEIGGPTFFLQAPDSQIWGEFELPAGVRIENGDGFNLFECKFLGVLYRELHPPAERPKKPYSEAVLAAWETWRNELKRPDVRVTWGTNELITLVPLETV